MNRDTNCTMTANNICKKHQPTMEQPSVLAEPSCLSAEEQRRMADFDARMAEKQKAKMLCKEPTAQSVSSFRQHCSLLFGRPRETIGSNILKHVFNDSSVPFIDNREACDLFLNRFAGSSAFARSLAFQFIRQNGHLMINKPMKSSGEYWSNGLSHVIALPPLKIHSLPVAFDVLAHELGHMQCKALGITQRVEKLRHCPRGTLSRKQRHLNLRVRTHLKKMVILRKKDKDAVLYHYAGWEKTNEHASVEEAMAEGYAEIVHRIRRHPTNNNRKQKTLKLFRVATKTLADPIVSLLVKKVLPQQGFAFSASQKGRMGLRPGQKHRLHPLYAQAAGQPELRWV